MDTRVIKLGRGKSSGQAVKQAAEVLRSGGLVAFPTETVYGIAANADDAWAMKRLRDLKERPKSQPFTVLIADKQELNDYVGELHWPGIGLVRHGWPGPLTLIFHVGREHSPSIETKNLYYRRTIGIRCPKHPVAEKLLGEAEFPVVAPSANRKGRPAAVQASEVLADLDGELDLVLDGGSCRYGRASTIVEVKRGQYQILRQGVLDERIIAEMAQMQIMFVCTGNTCRSAMAEGLFRAKLAKKLHCKASEVAGRGFRIFSSGTMGLSGAGATANAVKATAELGADIRGHVSQGLNRDNIQRADQVLVMTERHLQEVLRLVPAAKNKAKCLDQRGDIGDPIGLDLGGYRKCAARLGKLVDKQLKELKI